MVDLPIVLLLVGASWTAGWVMGVITGRWTRGGR